MERKTLSCNELDEDWVESILNEIEGYPDVINEKLLPDTENGDFNKSNSNEQIQRNPELQNTSYSDATGPVTSNGQDLSNKSECATQSSQIEIYSEKGNNSNQDTEIGKNTQHLNEILENKEADLLAPESMEIFQGLLLNTGRGISSPAPGIASECNDLYFKKDQIVLKEHAHEHSKKRTEWTETGDSEAVKSYRQNLFDLNHPILSTNNDYRGLKSHLIYNINGQTHLIEQSYFSNQPLLVDGNYGDNIFMRNGENIASNTNISEIIEKESTENSIICSGESKAEIISYDDKLAATPGPSYEDSFMCSICKKEINEHVILHEGQNVYMCCCCGYRTNRNDHLKLHMKRHGPEPFTCEVCGETYKERDYHDSEQTCGICKEKFQCRTLLLEHSIIHKSHCNICWRVMDQHKISECTGGVRYKCCECEHEINNKTKLRMHFYKHFEEKAFRRDECGKRYKEEGSLVEHINRKHKKAVLYTNNNKMNMCGSHKTFTFNELF